MQIKKSLHIFQHTDLIVRRVLLESILRTLKGDVRLRCISPLNAILFYRDRFRQGT